MNYSMERSTNYSMNYLAVAIAAALVQMRLDNARKELGQ